MKIEANFKGPYIYILNSGIGHVFSDNGITYKIDSKLFKFQYFLITDCHNMFDQVDILA